MQFTSQLTVVGSDNWQQGVLVPKELAEALIEQSGHRRVVAVLDGTHKMQCGLIPTGGDYFLYLNAKRRQAWNYELDDQLTVELAADTSEYGMEMPEEWAEMLDLDPAVAEEFKSLTPGRQRNIMHRIAAAKRVATRVNRAVQLADYLREFPGRFDYREMNEYLKNWGK